VKNPILQNYQSKLLYVALWAIITAGQVSSIAAIFSIPWGYLITEALVFNTIYACLLIPVWYPVRFNGWERKTWQFNTLVHLFLVELFVALSLSLGSFIMWLLATDSNQYMAYLQFLRWWKIVPGFMCYLVTVLVYYLYIHVEKLREKAANEIRLNQLIKDNELNLLKSQINPHFLFNSLNSLNALILRQPEQAQKMLVALSDYLRYAVLANNTIYATVQHEIENSERYLSIEKLRFGDKLVYELCVDPACLPLQLPAMLLQPLFENAVKHGVYESLQTVHIHAGVTREAHCLTIAVSNDYDAGDVTQKKGSGTGLTNIRERLRLSYGGAATLQTTAENGKFTAILKIPVDGTR
jgi:sensor histidine kinase YesM